MDRVKEAEFIIKETPVRVRIIGEVEQLSFAGLSLNSLIKGQEVEVPFWAAEELVKSGVGEYMEERFSFKELAKAHWREALPTSRQLSNIGDHFYFNLRRFLKGLKEDSYQDAEKRRELDKANSMARDIINRRVRKLTSLAASQVDGEEVTKNLTLEERGLFESIKTEVESWIRAILEEESLGESTGEP